MYNFTKLAVELNEMEANIAPSDSRLRPDQRLMEEANWDEANLLKIKIEEKQRAKRRENESKGQKESDHKAVWFEKILVQNDNNCDWVYKNNYWQCKEAQNWSECPDLF